MGFGARSRYLVRVDRGELAPSFEKGSLVFRSLLPTRILPTQRRIVEVGWLLFINERSLIFDAPRPVFRKDVPAQNAKAASFCPAIIDHESRIFEVASPYDLRLACRIEGERVVA